MALSPGAYLGPYEVLSLLGTGGTGEVYKARDTRLNRTVALKLLARREDGGVGSILREARAAARLNHPNIAAIYDVVENSDPPFLVMEFVDGEPLSATAARGPMDPTRVMDIGIALSSALAYAHGEGIIHRDVKPANVAVTKTGTVKLLDLGIARSVAIDPAATTHTSTESGALKGTPAYMAPEQLMGRPATERTDVYATGVLLYELLTGRRPFHGDDLLALAVAAGTGPTPRVAALRRDVPSGLDQIVARAMARNPAERFPSASALRDALELVQATGHADRDTQRHGRRRPRGALIVLAAGVMIAAAFVAWRVGRRPSPLGPAPILIVPARNASGDAGLDTLGAGLVSALADNLAVASGLTIVAAPATASKDPASDLRQLASDQGAGYAIALTMRPSGGAIHVDSEMVKAGLTAPVWRTSVDGSPLEVERQIVEGVATALEWYRILPREATADQSKQLRRLPTNDARAFDAFARGRALLDTKSDTATAQRAIDEYQSAIGFDPTFGLALAGLSRADGVMFDLTKDPAWIDRAADAANRALAIDPNRSLVHVSLSRVYRAAARLEDALQHATIAATMSPQSEEAHRELASVHFERHDLPAALAELRTAVQLRPNSATTQALLGFMLIRSARYRDAIEPLTRATQLNPNDGNSFQSLGVAYQYLGDRQNAVGNYEHALRLSTGALRAKALSNLATAYYANGQFQEAVDYYRQSIAADARSPTSHANLGDAYVRLNKTDEAKAEYTEAAARARAMLDLKPGDGGTIAILAMCEAKLGHTDQATRLIAEALAIAPGDVDVAYKAAVVNTLNHRPDQALQHLQRALETGYPAAFVSDDWDLRDLRTNAQFTSLVNRFAVK